MTPQDWLNIEHTWALDQAEPTSPFGAVIAQVQAEIAQLTRKRILCPLCKLWIHPNTPHECRKDGAYVKF